MSDFGGGDWKSVWFGNWHKEPGGREVSAETRPKPEPAGHGQAPRHISASRFTVQYSQYEQQRGQPNHGQHGQSVRRYTGAMTFNFLQVSPVAFPPLPQMNSSMNERRGGSGAMEGLRHPQVKELLTLYDRLYTTEFRSVIQRTLCRLAQHVNDDQVFLNLHHLPRLPSDEQQWEGSDGSSSSLLSWGRREDSGARAQAALMEQLYDALCRRSNLSNLVFVLGLKLTHMYRQRLAQAKEREEESSSTPSSLSSSTSYSAAPRPADVIQNAQHQLIVGIMLANKYTEDRPHSNAAWSRITGLPAETVNRLEASFLRVLGHKLFVEEAEFKEWMLVLSRLLNWIPEQQRHVWQNHGNPGFQPGQLSGGMPGLRFPTYMRKLAERRPSEGLPREDPVDSRPSFQAARSQRPPGL